MNSSLEYKKKLTARMIAVILFLLIVFGVIFGWGLLRSFLENRYFANFKPPPETISTATAISQTWQPTLSAVGSFSAEKGVTVSSQVPGAIVKMYFQPGQMIKAGQPIVQLDDSEEQQDLKNFQAQLTLSEITFRRQSILYSKQSVALSELDQARAQLQSNAAQVGKTQAIIAKKHIVAPFSGKLGMNQVNIGQYVNAGTAIVSLQAFDPLNVDFNLPQQYLFMLRMSQPIQIIVESLPNDVFNGKIIALDSQVDPGTRNIAVRGLLSNPQFKLFPGMYINVKVILPQKMNVVTVPQTAVTYSLYGDTIYVVTKEGADANGKPIFKVHARYVTTGEQFNNRVVILKGIKANEVVVTSGQLKLVDGAVVNINNEVTPNLPSPILEKKTGTFY